MDQHELIIILKNHAIELGRTPAAYEFYSKVRGGKGAVQRTFGTYTAMVLAAGLEPKSHSTKPIIDNKIFNKDVEKHLTDYEPKELIAPTKIEPWPEAAFISDVHWPFVNQLVLDKFYEYLSDAKPKFVILNGDAWDMYSHTKFPRSHNIFTPREEQALARKGNEEFWIEVKKRAPGARCVQMLGNHDIRPLKRTMEVYPEAEDWMMSFFKTLFTFDGVETIFDVREELFLTSNVIVFHGYRGKLGDHRDYTHYCCVNGHSHVGGVVFRQIRGNNLFELNSGYAGDPFARGLTYTPQKITHWTSGFAAITKYGPQFIPVHSPRVNKPNES